MLPHTSHTSTLPLHHTLIPHTHTTHSHTPQLMVAESLDIARETYFALVLDRSHQGPVMVGSPAGGMDIEEVAEKTPEKIFKVSKRENSGVVEHWLVACCTRHTCNPF